MVSKVYLIGSLRNKEVISYANDLRDWLPDVTIFDDWMAAGPEADDYWKEYETARGRSYAEALGGFAARHVFNFDRHHLDTCDAAILALPAGKSGHLELGYAIGRGKMGYILLDEPDRWDVMYQFAKLVTTELEEIVHDIKLHQNTYTVPQSNVQ